MKASPKQQRPPRTPKENVDPSPAPPPDPSPCRTPSAAAGRPLAAKNRSPLPPRPPPSSNPLKRKLPLGSDPLPEAGAPAAPSSDSGVQVIVRIRPPNPEEEGEDDVIAKKVASDSVSIHDHTFTFDSVADTGSTQEELFYLVGLPLVENCLAGFNSSIFAYGQTGSGKTYTMWGPPSAFSDGSAMNNQKGLTPRVFERLFSRIDEEQAKHCNKQLTYQCCCSFLEIYNEQITDLLDPTQRNLQIREDIRTGVYVESLTEEYVCTPKDVTQLLIKGLSNRRTGATSVNAESSRSHCVFTCVIKSQSKNMEDGSSSIKISRINLVDLAGSERQKLTNAAGDRLKEAGNINRSLSQLGNLINILAEISKSGKQRHVPYRDSKLTFLLQESLGGNAKLAMICAISPSQSCKNETISTLRFAQRAKAIKNKAIVNEITHDDVNHLREQIRLLKDELQRMKSNGASSGCNESYSTGWNARRSLNLLRMSLGRPKALPPIKDDSDEEMEIDENDVERPDSRAIVQTSVDAEEPSQLQNSTDPRAACPFGEAVLVDVQPSSDSTDGNEPTPCLSIVACESSPTLRSPTLSTSPVVESSSRKSLRTSSSVSASQKAALESPLDLSFAKTSQNIHLSASCMLPKNSIRSPTQTLASSLHRGLQIIESHQKNASMRRASFCFSVNPVDAMPIMPTCKVDVGIQTVLLESETQEGLSNLARSSCKDEASQENIKDSSGGMELQLVPVDESGSSDKPRQQKVFKAVEKVLAGAIRREMALEDQCAKQAAEITQLNRLVQQYKHERECNVVIAQMREDKISRLESLMDGILPTEEFMDEEFISLANEHKLLQKKYENHPEVLRVNIKLKRVQEELDRYHNFFDIGEKDLLMEEIQDLRNQLQYFVVPSSRRPSPLLQLAHAGDPLSEVQEECADEKLEEERRCWTEAESQWITLTEELRMELEASRSNSEKCRVELESEKKYAQELKEALQTAMQGHARILEELAELQEKHIALLARHRKIQDGIGDVKRAAAKAGIKGAESKFINSLAAEICVLRAEREKEQRYWRDENRGLQAQLRDTAEAVQAAGELLVRLKEAEEAAALAQKRALLAEQETEKAYEEIDNLKKNYDKEIILLNQFLADSRLPKDALKHDGPRDLGEAKFDGGGGSPTDKRWQEEFEPFCQERPGEVSKGTDPSSWFFGYDRCNI